MTTPKPTPWRPERCDPTDPGRDFRAMLREELFKPERLGPMLALLDARIAAGKATRADRDIRARLAQFMPKEVLR